MTSIISVTRTAEPSRRTNACWRTAMFLITLVLLDQAGHGVTLEWDANPESDIAGYRVYYGTAGGNYVQTVDVGSTTTATVPPPAAGTTQFFAVTACNTAGLKSVPSDEISFAPNRAPVAGDDSATVDEGSTARIAALANDSDPDAGPAALTIRSTTNPANGAISIAGNNVVYTPNAGCFGTSVTKPKREKMNNPKAFQDYYPEELSHCYGCGRLNPYGHQLKSYWNGVRNPGHDSGNQGTQGDCRCNGHRQRGSLRPRPGGRRADAGIHETNPCLKSIAPQLMR